MKQILVILACTIPSIACVVGAVVLALNGIGGWGWFLFIALITNPLVGGVKIKY
jgi:hypothetical protein